MVARTRYARPRYLPIVFAVAGDSTMTSDVPPGSLPLLSSMISGSACFAFDARDAVLVARFFAVVFAAALVVLARAIVFSVPCCCRCFRTNLPDQFPREVHADRRALSVHRIASTRAR